MPRDKIGIGRFYAPNTYPEFALHNGQPPAALLKLPALLMPEVEGNAAQSAYIAKLSSVRIHEGIVHVEFRVSKSYPVLVVRDVVALAPDLDISTAGYSLTHTHWTVNNADLLSVLRKNNLIARSVKRAKATEPPAPPRVRTAVMTNADGIIVMAEALRRDIDEKIQVLRGERPNHPDAQHLRDSAIADYESLRAQVALLQAEIIKLKQSSSSVSVAAQQAQSFGTSVSNWWRKDSNRVLSHGASASLILSLVGFTSLIGVNPTVSMAVSSALIGGKPVVDAIKAVVKKSG